MATDDRLATDPTSRPGDLVTARGRRIRALRPVHIVAATVMVATLAAAGTLVVSAAGLPAGTVTGSNPADRATLATAPVAAELTFSGTPDAGQSHIGVVSDRSGATVNAGPLIGAGRTLRQPVSIDGPASLTVGYHVVFRDGGDASGRLVFTVGAPAAPHGRDEVAAADPAAHDHGVDPLSGALLLIDAVAVLVVIGLLILRRPPHRR